VASLTELAARWRNDLAAWAIPDEILAAVDESPWAFPSALFARRADRELAGPGGPTHERLLEALPQGGVILDVGAGAGAASLPAAVARNARLIAVDLSEEMLDRLEARAADHAVPTSCVQGRWPDCADLDDFGCDVAICKDVLYNVPELPEFLAALTARARRRVVVELTAEHPLSPLNPLWLRLHGLRRPDRPSAADVYDIAAAMGLHPRITRWMRPGTGPYPSFDELVEVTRTRLCVPRERTDDVAKALRDLGTDPLSPQLPGTPERAAATLWWSSDAL
jgi:methyltransferase family protein